jgi:HSP20 family protein
MATLQELSNGLGRVWDNIAEGWHQLSQRVGQALTRFNPSRRGKGDLETMEEQLLEQSSRWGLLTADVFDDDDKVVVKLEAPGMDANDFDIQVVDDVLVVRGEKHIEREQSHGQYRLMECAYGSFERAIPLPAPVDEAQTSARYKKGVLRITLPKLEAGVRRTIQVDAG